MKWAIALALIGLVLVVSGLSVTHDLRGWEGMYPEEPSRIVATLPGKPDFTRADCVPWSVEPYGFPTAEEYSGSATATVLTCRSRSSALLMLLSYLVVAAGVLLIVRAARRRTLPIK